jgi:uncharacterized membrane protein YjjP (DUF1212 family)
MPTDSHPVQSADERILFVLTLAHALHEGGYATNRTEEILEATSDSLGLLGQYFVTPTSIFASFGTDATQRTFMRRTEPKPPDLGRLVRVTGIARSVLHREIAPAEGTARLGALADRPAPALAAIVLGHGLASGAAARFLGGGRLEIGIAAIAGIGTGLLAVIARRLPGVGRVYELAAAFVCAFSVALLGSHVGGYSVSIATLAGLIVLVPGLTLTTAITELATSHLTAGTTRMAGAFMTFIAIGFGVALGYRVAALLGPPAAAIEPMGLAPWTNWVAVLVSAVAFSLLLRADWRDFGWILGTGVIAILGTRVGTELLGPELGVFGSALAVGFGSNLYNRVTLRPAVVTLVPGLLTLVPGSIGFRSVSALLESRVVAGIDTGFSMLLTAVSLVAGMLTAAAVFPERRLIEPPR